jgi:hypothetical protein
MTGMPSSSSPDGMISTRGSVHTYRPNHRYENKRVFTLLGQKRASQKPNVQRRSTIRKS